MNKVVAWVCGVVSVVASVSTVAGVVVTAMPLSMTACNNGGSCTYTSLCQADPKPTQDEITSCQNALANPTCGDLYSSYLGCAQNNQVCLANGTTNTDQTNDICGDKFAAYQDCCYGTEGGVPDGGAPACN